MKKRTILALALLLVTGFTQAQIRYGVKAGSNLNWLYSEATSVTDLTPNVNFQIGGFAQYDFWVLTLQPEVLFNVRTSTIEDANTKYALQYNANLTEADPALKYTSYNLEIPINLQYGYKYGKVRYFAEMGPYIGIHLGGSFNGSTDYYKSYDKDYAFHTLDWGAGLGLGAEYKKFQFKARYDWGFGWLGTYREVNDVYPSYGDLGDGYNDNVFFDMKNKSLSVSLGYIF
jgi:hypothetical protein